MEDDKFTFVVEWFDSQADLVRKYSLAYFLRDSGRNEIEMYDMKTGKKFLKRCPYPSLKTSDLFLGAKVVVYARQLTVVDYADDYTRRHFEQKKGRGFLVVRPSAVREVGKVLTTLSDSGFTVSNLRMVKLDRTDAREVGDESLSEDVCVAMEVIADRCLENLRSLAGPADPGAARRQNPGSLNATTSSRDGAVIVSETKEEAERLIALLFGPRRCPSSRESTATFDNCTCAIIKPHAVREGQAGPILSAIVAQGFEVSAMELFYLEKSSAEEFLEVYKGVVREYSSMVEDLCSGACLVLEVRAEDAVQTFREFTGPFDVEVAQHIRASTLRAKFGRDRVANAVHCTDLPEDGRLECEYFFHILQQLQA